MEIKIALFVIVSLGTWIWANFRSFDKGKCEGEAEATRRMQNQAVTLGHGEFRVEEDGLKFHWKCGREEE